MKSSDFRNRLRKNTNRDELMIFPYNKRCINVTNKLTVTILEVHSSNNENQRKENQNQFQHTESMHE